MKHAESIIIVTNVLFLWLSMNGRLFCRDEDYSLILSIDEMPGISFGDESTANVWVKSLYVRLVYCGHALMLC